MWWVSRMPALVIAPKPVCVMNESLLLIAESYLAESNEFEWMRGKATNVARKVARVSMAFAVDVQ